jgi:hypothetical protein
MRRDSEHCPFSAKVATVSVADLRFAHSVEMRRTRLLSPKLAHVLVKIDEVVPICSNALTLGWL